MPAFRISGVSAWGPSKIVRGGNRIGIYFLENGAAQRGSKVIYDREGSSIATIERGMVDWDRVFEDAEWFHWTGITPAISKGLCDVCLEGILKAKDKGLDGFLRFELPRKALEMGKESRRRHARTGQALRHRHRQRGRCG